MRTDPLNSTELRQQCQWQRERAWDVERDIPWSLGIDTSKYFLPLDENNIVFPGASPRQRKVLSQFVGLLINATIAEMEGVIHKLKDAAWNQVLRRNPVNPEMLELGELFFQDERKHSVAFNRYNEIFCKQEGISLEDMSRLLPKAFGSYFQRAIIADAQKGGDAFWWVVASVEEVSIEIYRMIHRFETELDPLYFTVHRKHLEDESRHRNYAFLMLELIGNGERGIRGFLRRKASLVLAQTVSSAWVIAELTKVYEAENLKDRHPFFAELATCLPLLRQQSIPKLLWNLLVKAPYISTVLNLNFHRHTKETAKAQFVPHVPLPTPQPGPLSGHPFDNRKIPDGNAA